MLYFACRVVRMCRLDNATLYNVLVFIVNSHVMLQMSFGLKFTHAIFCSGIQSGFQNPFILNFDH